MWTSDQAGSPRRRYPSDSELEFDEDGDDNASSPLPPLPPQTQTHEYAGHPIAVVIDEEDEEATKPSTAAKSYAATKSFAAIKSSVRVDERKLAAKPSTTGVVVELADKEKRVKNKR